MASKPKAKFEIRGYGTAKDPKPASPSASVIVVSPSNEILLLHRVQTSSAFPSAHVFPGGNLEASDGPLPSDPTDPARHVDSAAYRTGAIRELFEETGILLARKSPTTASLLSVSREQRRSGREAVYSGKTPFAQWLTSTGGDAAVLDTDRLIPFTHWITPPNVPKRFTTQMYIYFVDVAESGNPSTRATGDKIETMAPEWRRASAWLERARSGEIILFPPQFLLLYLISEVLDRGFVDGVAESDDVVVSKRDELRKVIEQGGTGGGKKGGQWPAWRDKFISPIGLQFGRDDKRQVLGLDKPGPELKDSQLVGEWEHVVLVKFAKEGPRQVEVGFRDQILSEAREAEKDKQSKL